MLKQTLNSINNILDNLIEITQQDMEDVKQANHEELFHRNQKKEMLIKHFVSLKDSIDSILVQRSQSGKDINELLSPEEDNLLGEFRTKLQQFYDLHKKFSKMAFSITNFYNNLLHKLSNSEPDIGYTMTPSNNHYTNLSLKG